MQLRRFCNSDYSNLVFMLEAIAKPNHGGLPERTILVVAVLQLPQFEVKKVIVENTLVGFAKGGIYENVIMSLLVMRGFAPGYFMPRSNLSEVDFLIEKDGIVVPIEVKAGNNASASFDAILERPAIRCGYKFVDGNLGQMGKKITLPHYMVMFL